MDAKRAQEIVESEESIRVMHGDDSIWIDMVDQKYGTATIHQMNDPANEMDVKVQELEER